MVPREQGQVRVRRPDEQRMPQAKHQPGRKKRLPPGTCLREVSAADFARAVGELTQ